MAEHFDLSGNRVLILEDSYYLASDFSRALKTAGADVIGPCPNEGAALAAIVRDPPSCGILDINLGSGPTFDVARELAARNVPFLFVTGHDDGVIPREFTDAPRVQKPVDPESVINALFGMLTVRRDSAADSTTRHHAGNA